MQPARPQRWLNTVAWLLAGVYALDRLLKLLAVEHFLRRPPPPAPDAWPSVSLLQPITRGASDLPRALACRAALRYDGPLQHVLICDEADARSVAFCQAWRAAHAALNIEVVSLTADAAVSTKAISTKIEKLNAGLPYAAGAILAFVDDDILLRPDAIDGLVRYLQEPRVGSVFGLAVYTDWSNAPSSLLSGFVNANALLAYLPLTYLVEPFTITGHFYALRREVFEASGGLDGMAGRFDDDHELARRVQARGLVNVQTPVLYDVDNHLSTLFDYTNQMRRWAIIPKLTMAPYLSPRQQAASLLGSAGNLIPPLLGLPALAGCVTPLPLAGSLALFAAIYVWCERRWLRRSTPPARWPLVLLAALVAPIQALAALLHGDTFLWRGRRIRLQRGGQFVVTDSPGRLRPPAGCQD